MNAKNELFLTQEEIQYLKDLVKQLVYDREVEAKKQEEYEATIHPYPPGPIHDQYRNIPE